MIMKNLFLKTIFFCFATGFVLAVGQTDIEKFLKIAELESKTTFIKKDNRVKIETYELFPRKTFRRILIRHEDTFNSEGRRTNRQSSRWDGLRFELEFSHTYAYDKQGNVALESVSRPTNPNGDYGEVGQKYKVQKHFDSNNRLLWEKFWSTSQYDEGNYSEAGFYLKTYKSYEYQVDESGRLTLVKSFNVNSKTSKKTWWQTQKYSYEGKNRLPSEVLYESDPYGLHLSRKNFVPPQTRKIYAYDPAGNLLSETRFEANGFARQEVNTYTDGKIKQHARLYKEGVISSVDVHVYAETGEISEIQTYDKP